MIGNVIRKISVILALMLWAMSGCSAQQPKPFSAELEKCDGPIAQATWRLWDDSAKNYAQRVLIQQRLLQSKDSYALYDLQGTFQNLVSMAARCRRVDRLLEFARDWEGVYAAMELAPGETESANAAGTAAKSAVTYERKAWVCRGGSICNQKNRLLNTEVVLNSLQGMGLLSRLANALAERPIDDEAARSFVAATLEAGLGQLRRAGTDEQLRQWEVASKMKADDIRDGQSRWLFTDQALWQLGLYAELAGIQKNEAHWRASSGGGGELDVNHRRAVSVLLAFFKSRVSLFSVNSPVIGNVFAADLDRGYWRLYKDNRYAGYASEQKPAECNSTSGNFQARLVVPEQAVPIIDSIGWDISHARRLVYVLDALERNRSAMQSIYGLSEKDLPSVDLAKRFAAEWVSAVWNGDRARPLFRNWLSGANGWYRVGYDNGTARCMEGYPPWGLTDSFPTGGYITWGKYYPIITQLGLAIYEASRSPKEMSRDFINKYYKYLQVSSKLPQSNAFISNQIMFWPTLVGVGE